MANQRVIHFAGYVIDITDGTSKVLREKIDLAAPGDYGADPIGNGTFRMVPSGDIVDFDERNRRLAKFER